MLQTYFVSPGSPKTYFVFSLNSMFHMFSKLFESQDLTFHLIFVKSCLTVSSCFYGKNTSKILQNLFHILLNNPIKKNRFFLKASLGQLIFVRFKEEVFIFLYFFYVINKLGIYFNIFPNEHYWLHKYPFFCITLKHISDPDVLCKARIQTI